MCLGGKKAAPPTVPAPTPAPKFEYVNADTSNGQQKQAAIMSSTGGEQPTSFGAELGSAAPATPTGVM